MNVQNNSSAPKQGGYSNVVVILLVLLVAAGMTINFFWSLSNRSNISKLQNQQAQKIGNNDVSSLDQKTHSLQGQLSDLSTKVSGLQQSGTGSVTSDSIQGPAGPKGNNGATGPAGSTGVAGAAGIAGPQGPSGSATCPNGACLSLQPSTPGTQETGNINISGTIIANSFSGTGSALTNLNATSLASGTLSDSRLSANVSLLNGTGPQTFTGNNKFTGTFLAENAANSTTAFQIQNATGTNVLNVDTTNGEVEIGVASSSTGKLVLFDSGGSGSVTIQAANPSSINYTITLPAATGTVCLTTKNCSGAELDYVQYTSDVATTATSEATANTIVTANSVSYDGSTAVMINFYAERLTISTTNVSAIAVLYEDGSSIGQLCSYKLSSTTNVYGGIFCSQRITPSSGSHTYSIRGFVSSAATATWAAGAGGSGNPVPGYIRIVRAN